MINRGMRVKSGVAVFWLMLGGVACLFGQDSYLPALDHTNDADGVVRVYASNPTPVTVFFRIEATRLDNLEPSLTLPALITVNAESIDEEVLTFLPIEQEQSMSLRYSYTFGFGDPSAADHADDALYLFPFAHGSKYEISQSHFGKFTHNDPENRFAVDFTMPIGTPVHAAREGIVAAVKVDSNVGGRGSRYSQYGNYILIAHDDGSFGNYVHLRANGAEVEIGQEVAAGELIGYSGNTGNTSGPHLHFDVRIPTPAGKMESIPVNFMGVDTIVDVPKEAVFYYSTHPGREEFVVELGAELTVEDFTGYIRAVERTDRLNVRSDQIDNSFVLYIRNGYDYDHTVEINVDALGVSTEVEYPLKITVPAQSELFCGLFHRAPGVAQVRILPRVQVILE